LVSANSLNISNYNSNTNKYIQLSSSVSFSQNAQLNINDNCLGKIVTNNNTPHCYNESLEKYNQSSKITNNTNIESNLSINNTLATKLTFSENNSSTSTSNTSLPSFQNNNKNNVNNQDKNFDSCLKSNAIIDNKQTYV
jgi:hypothetical protein